MKRIITNTIVWVFSLSISIAAPVSEQAAMRKAQNFIRQQMPAMSRGEGLELTRTFSGVVDDEEAGFYVFNTVNGYVVVCADDALPEILAYGYGAPYDANNIPMAMKVILEAYHYAAKSMTFTRTYVPTYADVAPFITTRWNQDKPYNDQCPTTLSEGTCPTGCVATAMAQVMYYYQYPAVYEWNKMKTSYSTNDSGEAVDAVAKIMVDCGTASFMNYSVDGSGTSDIYACEALRYDFGYAETTEIVERECYSTESWEALLYNEISAKRPVMFGALAASSGQGISGHEFILDGYEAKNGVGYYHVNWGWGGQSDDYFLLSVLNPDYQYIGGNAGSSGFSFSQSAIIGIMPADLPMEKTTRAYIQNVYIKDDAGTYTRSSTSENFPAIDIGFNVYNVAKPEIDRDYDIAIALYNDREFISILDRAPLKDIIDRSLEYRKGLVLSCDSVVLGKDLADGRYQIRILSCESGKTEWAWAIESICRYIELTIHGNTMNTAVYGKEIEADVCDFSINKVDYTESPRIGRTMMITINLTDKNKTGNSPIFLWGNASISLGEDDFQLLTGGGTNLNPGETGEIVLEYTPQRSGSYTFILSGSRKNCRTPLYTFNVEVVAESITDIDISVDLFTENAEIQLDGTRKVQGNVLIGVVKLTNNGTEKYDNYVDVVLYERNNDRSFSSKELQKSLVLIDTNETSEVAYIFDNLATNNYYAIVVFAVERGETKALNLVDGKLSNNSIFFMTVNGSGIDDTTIDEVNSDVYNLHGVKVGKFSNLKELPKGVYIVNNQKVFNGMNNR